MQTDLRLILLIIGLFVVAAIFLDGIKRRKSENKENSGNLESTTKTEDVDPLLEAFEQSVQDELDQNIERDIYLGSTHQISTEAFDNIAMTPCSESVSESISESISESNPIIAMNILAKSKLGFSGKALLLAMSESKLKYGAKKIYHRYLNEEPTQASLYSVASIVEPGIFEVQTIAPKMHPGIILFMVANKVPDPVFAFEEMLKTANDMAEILNADICDTQGYLLSQQDIEQFRALVQEAQAKNVRAAG